MLLGYRQNINSLPFVIFEKNTPLYNTATHYVKQKQKVALLSVIGLMSKIIIYPTPVRFT